jgi:transcriptional regulator with XRE-family HTH domain
MTQNLEPLKKQIEKVDKKLINQKEISRRLGISSAYVHYLLNGKRKNDQLLAKIIEIIKNAA